jgi:hypothetical protein
MQLYVVLLRLLVLTPIFLDSYIDVILSLHSIKVSEGNVRKLEHIVVSISV